MAEAQKILMVPSVLDRLIDYDRDDPDYEEHDDESGVITTTPYTAEFLMNQIVRDLENLLQTTRTATRALPAEYAELSASVYQYGLPDRISFGVTDADNERLADEVRRAIALFEPRLHSVRVRIERSAIETGQIDFLISAQIRARPVPKLVHFDARLSTGGRSFRVSERTGAASTESTLEYRLAQVQETAATGP